MGATAVLIIDPKWVKQLNIGDVITVVNPSASWVEDEMQIHVRKEHGSHLLIHHSLRRGKVIMAELYSGLSGWNTACEIFGEQVELFVELDKEVAQALASQHTCPLVTPDQFVEQYLLEGTFERCVINGDCRDPMVWVAMGLANVGTILASPPCQPWCSVGNTKGLNSEEGQLLPLTGQWAGKLGVSLLMMENVAGFPKHDDFRKTIQLIETQGLALRLHGVYQVSAVLPVKRDRWIATFVQAGVQIPHERLLLAQDISFEGPTFRSVAKSPSVSDADAVHVNMSMQEKHDLMIPQDAIDMLADAALAPYWVKQRAQSDRGESIMEARVVHKHQQLNGIMASYGRQHCIPRELLETKGLHTVLAQDEGVCRYWSPWEFASALGYGEKIVMAANQSKAWTMSGNGLSVAHGWLQIYKTHMYLGPQSPFAPPESPEAQVEKFQSQAIKLSNYKVSYEGNFQVLKRIECSHVIKKPRVDGDTIPPTVPFTAVEDDDDKENTTTKEWEYQPAFESVQDPRCVAVVGDSFKGGVMVIVHGQRHWAMFVNVAPAATIGQIVTTGLPHAKEDQFVSFEFQGHGQKWDQNIPCKAMQKVFFHPRFYEVSCVEKTLHIALKLVIDVTWTAKSATAYIAVQLGCNPDVLALMDNKAVLCDDDFLMAYETVEYKIKFKACMPRYVHWAPSVTKLEDPGINPVRVTQCRWFARHPAKKVVRTIVADRESTVMDVVQALFPDLHALSCWKAYDSVDEIPTDAFANAWSRISVQWEGFRPFRVSELRMVRCEHAVDNPLMQIKQELEGKSLCIRSPFHAKMTQIRIDKSLSLGEIASSFLLNSQVSTNMLCMKGAVVMDPETTVENCVEDGVYSFRMCPMLGGAKFEPIRNRLKSLLASKGVPDDKVVDRLNAFASKVQMDRLSSVADSDDEGFWNLVKSLATEVKFRLITSGELKAHQASMRKGKGKGEPKTLPDQQRPIYAKL
eukprot:Skav228721  [mRNA]  locus=scaffold1830:213859:217647:- [translate_table: standard]